MKQNVDIIKGLSLRIGMNFSYQGRDKKREQQLSSKIRNNINAIARENNDEIFVNDFNSLISNDITNTYITSNFFPCDYNEYGSWRPYCDYINDFRLELRWIVFSLKYYSEQISDFILAREEYDNCILLNNYEKALSIVNDIEKKSGVSLWSAECKFFLCSKQENNMNNLMEKLPNSIIAPIFNFFELRNRDNVTNNEYNYIVEKELRVIRRYLKKNASIIDFFKYVVEGIMYECNTEDIMNIIRWIRNTSIIDQYLFFIDICDFAIVQDENSDIYTNIKNYIQELSCIEDEHLIALRFIFDDSDNKKRNYVLKNKLEDAKQEFIKGNLAETREKSIKLLETYPNNIEAINLLVETNILLNNEEEVFANTNLGMLISKLKSVYTLDDNRDNEIDEINKFTNCQSWSSWAKSIRNAIVYRCKEYDNIKVDKSEILANLQYLDIETVIASLNKDECVGFINNKLDLNNQYIAFRKACCENDFDGAILLCNIPQIKDLLFVCDTRNSIEDKIAHLGSVKGTDASIAIMRIKYFIANLDIEENYDVILDISAKLIAENIYTSLFIPLKKIIDYIDGAGENIRKNICSPILYYVYSYYFKRDKIDDLGIVCEDFFLFNDIERPTRMDIYAYDSMDLVIFFLRNVCNSKVMDMAVWDFKNSQDREQERLGICNILNEIDATNSEEYDKEIREITQRLMINKELTTIEENRIHVNVDGIKEKLIKEYKNDFFRYKFYEDKSYEEWLALIPREEISILRDASKRILKELVFHIRDAFVSSDEYGLDVYLSLNIRHGTLADELRGPINRTMLNAKKDVATGDYIINSNWMKEINDDDRNRITNAISEFYIETESIISKLKGRYIQIQTEEKKTGGLFDYTLYELDIMSISGYISGVDSFEDFFDYIISYMWSITEENLVNIKQKIKTEILEDYNNAFDVLKAKISTIKSKDKMRELLQKINEAATDMPNVLDKICYWFQRSTESKHNDFDLQFAFDMGLQTIRNIHPEKEFVAIPKVETVSEKIKGYYLKDYDSIFYNLFANIYKYAYSKNGRRIEIRYELKYQNGETYIYLENDYDCSQDISFEIAKIEEQKAAIRSKEYKKRIKGEGGTGIPKICNIIVSDIKNELAINYDFVADDNLFFIEISFWER